MAAICWKNWCRLCGSDKDTQQIDKFNKNKNFVAILKNIQNLLLVPITFVDATTKICQICYDFLICYVEFSEKVVKIQDMFIEVELTSPNKQDINNLNALRHKYGLTSQLPIIDDVLVSEPESVISNPDSDDIKPNKLDMQIPISNKDEVSVPPITNPVQDDIKRNKLDRQTPISNKDEVAVPHVSNLISTDIKSKKLGTQTPISNKNALTLIDVEENVKTTNCKKEPMKHNRNASQNIKEMNHKQISKLKPLSCKICSKKFTRKSNLTTHLKYIHSIEKELPFCDICDKTFRTVQHLNAHKQTHLPFNERLTAKCPYCLQILSSEAILKEHIRYKHTLEKLFMCDECGKSFITKQTLKIHKFIHEPDSKLHCKKCPKVFKNVLRLNTHMKLHREQTFPCSICGLELKTPKTLKNHMVIHTDNMPFQCNFCGAAFRRDKNLRTHMITHTGLKPYECPFCSQSYANRSNCKKHQKHAHPKEYATLESSGVQHYSKNVPKLNQLQLMLEQMKSENESLNVKKK